jgi:thiol-disulfide isomerase/thioredoxin
METEKPDRKLYSLLFFSIAIFITGCGQKSQTHSQFTINGAPAPDINTAYGWLNTKKPYTLKDFQGKILVLDFWTLGCINCQHIIPDLQKLEQKFSNEIVIVGVHSAKFKSEKETKRIQAAIAKLGIDHPVVNDADYAVWKAYGVNAWPTLVLISPDGKIAFKQEGENVYDVLRPQIEKLAREYAGAIKEGPFVFKQTGIDTAASVLKFPSKMVSDEKNNIWVSDYGNNRIVKIGREGRRFYHCKFQRATRIGAKK